MMRPSPPCLIICLLICVPKKALLRLTAITLSYCASLVPRTEGHDAGVVHHYVEPTEPLHRRIDEFLKVGTLAHVSCDANRLATQLADLPLERLGRIGWTRSR